MSRGAIITVSVFGAIALASVYFIFIHKSSNKDEKITDKATAIKAIQDANYQDSDLFVNRDAAYLISWATAIKNKGASFMWNGKSYNVHGGQLA